MVRRRRERSAILVMRRHLYPDAGILLLTDHRREPRGTMHETTYGISVERIHHRECSSLFEAESLKLGDAQADRWCVFSHLPGGGP